MNHPKSRDAAMSETLPPTTDRVVLGTNRWKYKRTGALCTVTKLRTKKPWCLRATFDDGQGFGFHPDALHKDFEPADRPHRGRPRLTSTQQKVRRIREAERVVHTASHKLARLRDPDKKLALMWRLAWVQLRDLENYRPAGGFAGRPSHRERSITRL